MHIPERRIVLTEKQMNNNILDIWYIIIKYQ